MRAGSGCASLTSVAPATSTESRPVPKPPTQKKGIGMYRRSSPVTHRASRPASVAPERAAVGVDHAFGSAAAPGGEDDRQVVGRPHRRGERVDDGRIDARFGRAGRRRGRLGPHVDRAQPRQRAVEQRAGLRHQSRRDPAQVVEVAAAAELGTRSSRSTAAVRSWLSSSGGRRRVLSGTTTAPTRASARAATAQPAPFGMRTPTRVPFTTPPLVSRVAAALVVCSSSP